MTGMVFDLKPCRSRSTRLDWSSQLIWVDPNVLMYLIKSNVGPHMCLIHALGLAHDKLNDSSRPELRMMRIFGHLSLSLPRYRNWKEQM